MATALDRPVDWWKNKKNYDQWLKSFFVPKVMKAKKEYGISVPYHFIPRPYQMDVVEAMYTRRFVAYCMHRRAGKDYMSVSMLLVKCMEKVGNYVYCLPTATQGRKIVWEGIDNDGMRFIDHIPRHLIKINPKTKAHMINNNLMMITLVNGSTIQVIGSDNYDRSLVGTNVAGIIFSEYSLNDPKAWIYVRPILSANLGWAWFNGTPRGKNHFFKLLQGVMESTEISDDWYACIRPNSQTCVISDQELTNIRAEGQMSEQQMAQEFECAFEGCLDGVIYANQITEAQKEGRFGDYVYDRKLPVYVAFDLGAATSGSASAGDRTAMTFFQQRGDRPWVIDFYACKGMGVNHFKMVMDDFSAKYGYDYRCLFLPHDSAQKNVANYDDQGYALTIHDTFRREFGSLDIKQVERCNSVNDDIEVVRSRFYKWYFFTGHVEDKSQKERLDYFYSAMEGYTYPEVDEMKKIATTPVHNWCSDPMDSFRYAVKAQAYGWAGSEARTWLSKMDEDYSECDDDDVALI